jgi:hypothetical protein
VGGGELPKGFGKVMVPGFCTGFPRFKSQLARCYDAIAEVNEIRARIHWIDRQSGQ